MRLSVKRSNNKTIAIAVFSLAGLLVLSLIANIITGCLAWRSYYQQRTVTVPMFFNQPFTTSLKGADWNYIHMATLSFIALRLNVTPETVDSEHKTLLSYVAPAIRPQLANRLALEAKNIKTSNVTSAFYVESLTRVPNSLSVVVKGVLKSVTGTTALADEHQRYLLSLSYYNGVTTVDTFKQLPYEEKTQ